MLRIVVFNILILVFTCYAYSQKEITNSHDSNKIVVTNASREDILKQLIEKKFSVHEWDIEMSKSWKINQQEIIEAKRELMKINLLVLNNDLEGFNEYLEKAVIFVPFSYVGDFVIAPKKDFVDNGMWAGFIVDIFFPYQKLTGKIKKDKGTDKPEGTYTKELNKILEESQPDDNYFCGIRDAGNLKVENNRVLYVYYSAIRVNEELQEYIGFGIYKHKGVWKITYIY